MSDATRSTPDAGWLAVVTKGEGLRIDELEPLDRLIVFTFNSRYEIIVLCPTAGRVLIRGGEIFDRYVVGRVASQGPGGPGFSEPGIYVGHPVALLWDGQGIVTTCVRVIERVPTIGHH
jgi:hypothetical protein